MKIISWNTRGLKAASKRLALKNFLKKHNPELVLIQESKCEEFDITFIKSIWSSKDIGWEFVESFGKSGGILTMWDESKISIIETLKGGYSLSVKCLTLAKKSCWVTHVYGPNDYRERRHLWSELQSLSVYCLEPRCIRGDFNITR